VSVSGIRVGLVGCGKISQAYLSAGYPNVTYVACADIDEARAKAAAETYHLQALSVSELLAYAEVDADLPATGRRGPYRGAVSGHGQYGQPRS
jgi:predicted dehydrogenase